MGVLSRVEREGELGEMFNATPQHIIDGAWLSQTPAGNGEVRGGGNQSARQQYTPVLKPVKPKKK